MEDHVSIVISLSARNLSRTDDSTCFGCREGLQYGAPTKLPSIAYQACTWCRLYLDIKTRSFRLPDTTESIPITYLKSSQVRSPTLKYCQYRPPRPETSQFPPKISDLRPASINRVNFDHHHRHKKRVNFNPHTKTK